MKKKIFDNLLSVVGLFLLTITTVAAATTFTISGNTALGENQEGWLFNRDTDTDTPYTFNTDAESIGAGSLYILPIGTNAPDKFIGENFLNTPIANVHSISYDFKIGSGGTSTQEEQFYMNVYANFGISSDTKYYDCRYNLVPTAGSTSDFTTVTFDPTATYPVAQSGTSPFTCPDSPAAMDNLSTSSTIRMFALNVGDTSANDQGLDGYLDKVVVNTNSNIITYDFEPVVSPTPTPTPSPSPSPTLPTSKDECKKDGWMSFIPLFKNQGDCVSSTVKNSHSNK